MRKNNEPIDIAGAIEHETPKAYLIDDGARKEWCPKSEVQDNGDGTFTMPEWLAKEKGFI